MQRKDSFYKKNDDKVRLSFIIYLRNAKGGVFAVLDFMREKSYFGNTLEDYALALLVFMAVVVAVTIVQRIIIARINKTDPHSEKARLASVLRSFKKRLLPITYITAIYTAMPFLKIPAIVTKAVDKTIVVFISVFVIFFITDCIRIFSAAAKGSSSRIPPGVASIFQVFVWIFGVLFILANLGYNVSTFITGLGIGGVAIALASQAILGDLFNYFVILFDKPFKKGDVIQVDSFQGTVEYIGVKSTRIRSNSGEQLLISNTDLTKSRLQNFKNMARRRNLTILGVEYGTSPDKLKLLPDLIKKTVESVPGTEFSRVHFSEFGSSSLNFELAYFVHSNDYVAYINAVQSVNYALLDAFEKNGISFAFPSQTVYFAKGNGSSQMAKEA